MTMAANLKQALDAAFKPASVAVIGASNSLKLGGADMRFLIESGYRGKVYPVNPKEEIVQGYQAYQSILDIPEPVERAAIAVPSRFVRQAVAECAQKGVRVIQIYTAGFGEFGAEGKAVEEQMIAEAHAQGMRIIGPNCIGTYCPGSGLSFVRDPNPLPGDVAFVSQSGGIAFDMVARGKISGIRYSKAISVGNCIDLDHPDFLEYLAEDDETRVIGFYIESVKDGRRFMELLRRVTRQKPVVILKGGRTQAGSRSVASHTGSLSGDYEIWQGLFKQTGAIPVKSIDEMLVALASLQHLKPFSSAGTAIVGNGGGATVLATDYSEEVGLGLAELTPSTAARLSELGVAHGDQNANPIDMPANQLAEEAGGLLGRVLQTLSDDPTVAHLLFHINLTPVMNYMDLDWILPKLLEQLDLIDRSRTNVAVALRYNGKPEIERLRYEVAQALQDKGIPSFLSIEQALFGLSLVARHGRRLAEGAEKVAVR